MQNSMAANAIPANVLLGSFALTAAFSLCGWAVCAAGQQKRTQQGTELMPKLPSVPPKRMYERVECDMDGDGDSII